MINDLCLDNSVLTRMFNKLLRLSKVIHNLQSDCTVNKKSTTQFTRNVMTKLVFTEYGNPEDVVKKVSEKLPVPSKNEVLIRVLAAPVNPVDINIIQGKYPAKKTFPAVGGSEALGRVIEIGEDVDKFKIGDHVVLLKYNLGTWTTHMVLPHNILKQIPTKLPPAEAATLMTNPCTAYRMLKDFVNLEVGDIVIQNGPNSSCGRFVIQLCKLWGIKTVNVVRNRNDIDDLKQELLNLGASYVLTEEEFKSFILFRSGELQKPKLALNCVGGKSALELSRKLDQNGVMVTYGGMSMEPVIVTVSDLIFNNKKMLGFSINQWSSNCNPVERDRMLDELVSLFLSSNIKSPPYVLVPMNSFKDVLRDDLSTKLGRKYIFLI